MSYHPPTLLAAAALLLASTASTFAGHDLATDDKKVVVAEEKRTWFPDEGNVTLGVSASNHLTGFFLDNITGIYFSSTREEFFFLDSKYSWEDNDQFASSTGFGFRKLFPEQEIIVGLNGFYDGVHSEQNHDYAGFSGGLEVLTHWVDARVNYYYPDDDVHRVRHGSVHWYEGSLEGVEGEVGVLIPGLDRLMEVRVFAGYYHFNNPVGTDYEGFKARLEARLLPNVIAGVEYWDDAHLNGGHWTGTFAVSVPFSIGRLVTLRNPFEGWQEGFRPRQREFSERMGDMIVRAPRIKTAKSVH